MKLNRKFSIIVVWTVIQVIFLAACMFYGSQKMQEMKHYQYMQSSARADLCDIINFLNQTIFWNTRTTTIYRDWTDKVTTLDDDFSYLTGAGITKSFPEDFRNELGQMATLWNTMKSRFTPIEDVMSGLQSIKLSQSQMTNIQTFGIKQSAERDPDDKVIGQMLLLINEIEEQMSGIIRSEDTLARLNFKSSLKMETILAREQRIFTAFACIMLGLSCTVLAVLIRSVTKRITRRIIKIRNMTSVLTQKDFTASLEPEGSSEMASLMNNINDMVSQLNKFFIIVKTTASKAISSGYSINDSANSTAAATYEIDRNISNLTEEFKLMTDSVKKSVALINEMSTQVETLVSSNARQTQAIDDSKTAVDNVVQMLEHINRMAEERTVNAEEMNVLIADGDEKISATENILNQIVGQLDEIKDVITIIDSVSEQTNLLSMNAAIESAHAGDAGKGFAVVAEEIRNLAEETSENATRISNSINMIIESVSKANDSSARVSKSFSKVSSHADSVISSLREITGGIGKIDTEMQNIKLRSEETATAAAEINGFCTELAGRQHTVSTEVDSMNGLFSKASSEIMSIKSGTDDIVNRMKVVSGASRESYKNMTDLENVLEEFKTKSEVAEAVEAADSENTISNVVSSELQDFNPDTVGQLLPRSSSDSQSGGGEDIDFDLDNVEEYIP